MVHQGVAGYRAREECGVLPQENTKAIPYKTIRPRQAAAVSGKISNLQEGTPPAAHAQWSPEYGASHLPLQLPGKFLPGWP